MKKPEDNKTKGPDLFASAEITAGASSSNQNGIIHNLLWDCYLINDRLALGDILHVKNAVPILRKHCESTKQQLYHLGAKDIFIDCYDHGGGRVGVTYSFKLDGHTIEGTQSPGRRKL